MEAAMTQTVFMALEIIYLKIIPSSRNFRAVEVVICEGRLPFLVSDKTGKCKENMQRGVERFFRRASTGENMKFGCEIRTCMSDKSCDDAHSPCGSENSAPNYHFQLSRPYVAEVISG